ncbi:WD40-repeat-containing domain protein [Coniochaeta sp. 2T2.1]|nr:WD40-repeat-containing domain protein [Coniochaeta sp. 2T2.1]
MSNLEDTRDVPGRGAERPSKRRRVTDDGASPDRRNSPAAAGTEHDPLRSHNLSIRGHQPSNDSKSDNYPRATSEPSTPRSRSISPPRQRSYSRSRTRSRSRSRSPRTDDSRSRSRSRSPPVSGSRSPSRTRSRSHSGSPRRGNSQRRQPNYQLHLRLTGHGGPVSLVRISPDGRWLASASADGTAKIWDAETGEHMDTLVGHMAGVSCLAWAPDGDGLATGGDDKAIRLWDRVTASPAHAVGEGAGRGEEGGFGTMRRRANGGILRPAAAAGSGKGARGTRNGRGPLLGHHNYVYCLAFSPKGNILASGSYDEAVFLWDVRAGRLMRSLPAHSDPVSGIDFSRDGTLVASCSTDGLIRIWDTSTGQCLRTLVHEDNPAVTNVCFSPNGQYVLAFNLDNSIRLWEYGTAAKPAAVKKTYQGHKNSGYSIGGSFCVLRHAEDGDAMSTQQRGGDAFVASASEDGDIVMWDVKSKEVVQRISRAHKGVCFWVDVNGELMASAGQDHIVNVFKNQPPSTGKVANGINGVETNDYGEDSVTPYEGTADEELQRQIGADDATSAVKQEVKEEDL